MVHPIVLIQLGLTQTYVYFVQPRHIIFMRDEIWMSTLYPFNSTGLGSLMKVHVYPHNIVINWWWHLIPLERRLNEHWWHPRLIKRLLFSSHYLSHHLVLFATFKYSSFICRTSSLTKWMKVRKCTTSQSKSGDRCVHNDVWLSLAHALHLLRKKWAPQEKAPHDHRVNDRHPLC